MNVLQYFSEALESLNSNKLRSGLTILGIVVGVAAVISMLAIGQGASASVTNSITSRRPYTETSPARRPWFAPACFRRRTGDPGSRSPDIRFCFRS